MPSSKVNALKSGVLVVLIDIIERHVVLVIQKQANQLIYQQKQQCTLSQVN